MFQGLTSAWYLQVAIPCVGEMKADQGSQFINTWNINHSEIQQHSKESKYFIFSRELKYWIKLAPPTL